MIKIVKRRREGLGQIAWCPWCPKGANALCAWYLLKDNDIPNAFGPVKGVISPSIWACEDCCRKVGLVW